MSFRPKRRCLIQSAQVGLAGTKRLQRYLHKYLHRYLCTWPGTIQCNKPRMWEVHSGPPLSSAPAVNLMQEESSMDTLGWCTVGPTLRHLRPRARRSPHTASTPYMGRSLLGARIGCLYLCQLIIPRIRLVSACVRGIIAKSTGVPVRGKHDLVLPTNCLLRIQG